MKSKTFVILLIVFIIFGVIAYFILKEDPSNQQTQKMGMQIFANLPFNDVVYIEITGVKDNQIQKVQLKKGEKVWEVVNRFNYPADFAGLSDLIRKIKDVKVGRSFEADGNTLSRLGLQPPDAENMPFENRGTRVSLKGENDTPIVDIIFGKTRTGQSGPGGHYLMKEGAPTVYLVDQSFRLIDKTPSDLLDHEILNVKSDDIQKVVCVESDSKTPVYVLHRPEKGKPPELFPPPENKKLKKTTVDSLFGALASLRMEDVAGRYEVVENPGFETTRSFVFHAYDGTVYSIYPGSKVPDLEDKYFLRLEIAYNAPETDEEKPSDSAAEKEVSDEDKKRRQEQVKAAKKAADQAKKLNEKLSPWVYVIPEWEYKTYVSNLEGLFEEEPKKE
jgi:hypothetical protein